MSKRGAKQRWPMGNVTQKGTLISVAFGDISGIGRPGKTLVAELPVERSGQAP